jgi:hypothetical protein
MISLAVEHGVDLPQRPERWHGWNARKAEILDVAQRARSDIRRRRLFKCLVLSGPEFEIEDTQERRDAVARAWEIWTDGMGKIGL